jgi:hypothetical protein
VQRYDLFANWQNLSRTFFRKNEKKEQIGQKDERKHEFWGHFRGHDAPQHEK